MLKKLVISAYFINTKLKCIFCFNNFINAFIKCQNRQYKNTKNKISVDDW